MKKTSENEDLTQQSMSDDQQATHHADQAAMDHSHMNHDHSDHNMSEMDHSHMNHDHSDHNMSEMDHSHVNHDHSGHDMSGMDHSHMNHDHSGHDMGGMDHSMHMGNFKQKFWLSLVLAIPIILMSPMMGIELPFQFTFPGSNWVVLILATILFFYGGAPFLSGAKMELKMKQPAMMTLIAMGITVAYVYSLYSFVQSYLHPELHIMDFFWELATLIVIMLLGHWIEMNAVMNASSALQKMAELLPDSVTRIRNGQEEQVQLSDVKNGDQLIVRSGDKMPADGEIIKGTTTVDESMVTGESKEVKKATGDKVIGGSVNGDGTITLQVTATGESGYLAQVMEMVKSAQSEKSALESLSDRVAKWLFYVALFAGILAFVVWLFVDGSLNSALERMVTVFVIACPHALGLAIPLVIARSTSIAAKNGLLIKRRQALEATKELKYVMLDKTGTLTAGTFSVTGLERVSDTFSEADTLGMIGALEKNANHPLAKGIMRYLKEKEAPAFDAENQKNLSGIGLSGEVKGKKVEIINGKELGKRGLEVAKEKIAPYQEQGNTLSYLVVEDELIAIIALGDKIKPEAKDFIKQLYDRDITPVMLTGDNPEAARVVAEYLGIKDFHGGLLPDDKEKIVKEYLEKGSVMMVGDGINDAPSLARATIGVAIGAGTDVAIDSADVVLTNSNPMDILHFLDLAHETRRKMIQNLWWGAGYNIIAIPLAAGVLAPIGFILSPAVGAVLMSLSTIIVAINAMTLKMKR